MGFLTSKKRPSTQPAGGKRTSSSSQESFSKAINLEECKIIVDATIKFATSKEVDFVEKTAIATTPLRVVGLWNTSEIKVELYMSMITDKVVPNSPRPSILDVMEIFKLVLNAPCLNGSQDKPFTLTNNSLKPMSDDEIIIGFFRNLINNGRESHAEIIHNIFYLASQTLQCSVQNGMSSEVLAFILAPSLAAWTGNSFELKTLLAGQDKTRMANIASQWVQSPIFDKPFDLKTCKSGTIYGPLAHTSASLGESGEWGNELPVFEEDAESDSAEQEGMLARAMKACCLCPRWCPDFCRRKKEGSKESVAVSKPLRLKME
ncbi:MAG TPA: hypothetical protein VJ205_03575 [Gammaproteobacteria bacterium]|nr:hypothetical protein [Gammaproteobacteria bacterium]